MEVLVWWSQRALNSITQHKTFNFTPGVSSTDNMFVNTTDWSCLDLLPEPLLSNSIYIFISTIPLLCLLCSCYSKITRRFVDKMDPTLEHLLTALTAATDHFDSLARNQAQIVHLLQRLQTEQTLLHSAQVDLEQSVANTCKLLTDRLDFLFEELKSCLSAANDAFRNSLWTSHDTLHDTFLETRRFLARLPEGSNTAAAAHNAAAAHSHPQTEPNATSFRRRVSPLPEQITLHISDSIPPTQPLTEQVATPTTGGSLSPSSELSDTLQPHSPNSREQQQRQHTRQRSQSPDTTVETPTPESDVSVLDQNRRDPLIGGQRPDIPDPEYENISASTSPTGSELLTRISSPVPGQSGTTPHAELLSTQRRYSLPDDISLFDKPNYTFVPDQYYQPETHTTLPFWVCEPNLDGPTFGSASSGRSHPPPVSHQGPHLPPLHQQEPGIQTVSSLPGEPAKPVPSVRGSYLFSWPDSRPPSTGSGSSKRSFSGRSTCALDGHYSPGLVRPKHPRRSTDPCTPPDIIQTGDPQNIVESKSQLHSPSGRSETSQNRSERRTPSPARNSLSPRIRDLFSRSQSPEPERRKSAVVSVHPILGRGGTNTNSDSSPPSPNCGQISPNSARRGSAGSLQSVDSIGYPRLPNPRSDALDQLYRKRSRKSTDLSETSTDQNSSSTFAEKVSKVLPEIQQKRAPYRRVPRVHQIRQKGPIQQPRQPVPPVPSLLAQPVRPPRRRLPLPSQVPPPFSRPTYPPHFGPILPLPYPHFPLGPRFIPQ